jgi:tetratricopeptide (TPR) repeat protein
MEQAEEEWQRARTMLEDNATDNNLLADVLNKLGCISRYHGQVDAALAYYQRSSEIATQEHAYDIATKAINNMGNIYIRQGEISRAIACYNLGLSQAERADTVALAQAYTTLAWLHSNYGPYKLALEYAAKALALVGAIEDLNTRSLVVDQVGVVYLKHGDLEQAGAYLREAHALVQRTGNRIISENVTSHLAELMQQQDDRSAWLGYAMKAFHTATDSLYLREEAVLQLTVYHIKQGDLERAASLIQAFKAAPNGDAEGRKLAIVHYAEALLKSAAGNWAEAGHHFEQTIGSGKLTYYELAIAWQDYAVMLLEQDKAESNQRVYAKAFAAVEEAISLLRDLELPPYPSTGEIKSVYDMVSVS